MAVRQFTVNVDGVVTGIRIGLTVAGDPTTARVHIDGVLRNTVTGETIRAFSEDVTDSLPPAAKGAVTTIATRAQAWIDSKEV